VYPSGYRCSEMSRKCWRVNRPGQWSEEAPQEAVKRIKSSKIGRESPNDIIGSLWELHVVHLQLRTLKKLILARRALLGKQKKKKIGQAYLAIAPNEQTVRLITYQSAKNWVSDINFNTTVGVFHSLNEIWKILLVRQRDCVGESILNEQRRNSQLF
jgi:hypothetical protein